MLSPTNTTQSGVLVQVVDGLVARGVPYELVTFDRLEVLANVAMVVPAGFLAALSFPRPTWRDWAAYGFLAALAVELVQGFVLPARQASASDVVANTLGLLAGALVVSLGRTALRLARRRSEHRRSRC